MAEVSSAPEPEESPVMVAGSSTADCQADGLCGGAAIVIGDGDDEGIAVEVGVGCVGPGTGFGVNGSGAVGWSVSGFNGEIGAIGESSVSVAERVLVTEEVSSVAEPDVAPVMEAGSSTAVTDVERVSSVDEMEVVPPLVETLRVDPDEGCAAAFSW